MKNFDKKIRTLEKSPLQFPIVQNSNYLLKCKNRYFLQKIEFLTSIPFGGPIGRCISMEMDGRRKRVTTKMSGGMASLLTHMLAQCRQSHASSRYAHGPDIPIGPPKGIEVRNSIFCPKITIFNFSQQFEFRTIGNCRGDFSKNPDFSSKN